MNYYEILEIPRSASTKEIKTAFRRLARQYHPDVNGNSQENLDRFRQICQAYEVLSDSQQRRDYDRILELDHPQSYQTLYTQGLNHAASKDYPGAIKYYTRALEIDSRQWQIYLKRAEAYYQIHEYGNVLEDCRLVLQFNPTSDDAYYYMGLSRQGLGYTQSALDAYSQAIKLNPNYASAYYNRGLAQEELNNYQKAIQDLQTAAFLFAKNPRNNRNRLIEPKLNNLRKKQLENRKNCFNDLSKFLPNIFKILLSASHSIIFRPWEGLSGQFLRIEKIEAIYTGAISLILSSIFLIMTWTNWGSRLPVILLFVVGLIPGITLAMSSYLLRRTWQFYGHLEADIFMGGLSILPMTIILWMTSLLQISTEIKTIIILISGVYLGVIIYNNYLQLANFRKSIALLITPVILAIIGPIIWSIYYYF